MPEENGRHGRWGPYGPEANILEPEPSLLCSTSFASKLILDGINQHYPLKNQSNMKTFRKNQDYNNTKKILEMLRIKPGAAW